MQPISVKPKAKFRGPANSKEFNKWVEDNYYDLVQLFNIARGNETKIINNLDLLIDENAALYKKLTDLEEQLISIETSLSNMNESPEIAEKVLTAVFTSTKYLEDSYNQECSVNTFYGFVHVPFQQSPISKIYLINSNNEIFLPSSFKANLYESPLPFDITEEILDESTRVEDPYLINAFDGSQKTYWKRNVSYDSGVKELYAVIEVEIPQNIINHLKLNNINLVPAPEFGFSILDIKYYRNSSWSTIPTFSEPMRNASRKSFIFPAKEATKLRFYIKQDAPSADGGTNIFTYGFKNIDISFLRFMDGEFTSLIKFTVPNSEYHSFQSIKSITPISAEGGIDHSDLVKIEVFLDKEGMFPFTLDSRLPELTKEIYVKVTMEASNNTSPMISQVKFTYTTS